MTQDKQDDGKFCQMSKKQMDYLKSKIKREFFVDMEIVQGHYFFMNGDQDELVFGSFKMRRTSNTQIVISSNFKEFDNITSEDTRSITASELSRTINLPDE